MAGLQASLCLQGSSSSPATDERKSEAQPDKGTLTETHLPVQSREWEDRSRQPVGRQTEIPALPLTSHLPALGKATCFLGLSFLTCKMGVTASVT